MKNVKSQDTVWEHSGNGSVRGYREEGRDIWRSRACAEMQTLTFKIICKYITQANEK